jgi:hypothetical protein
VCVLQMSCETISSAQKEGQGLLTFKGCHVSCGRSRVWTQVTQGALRFTNGNMACVGLYPNRGSANLGTSVGRVTGSNGKAFAGALLCRASIYAAGGLIR